MLLMNGACSRMYSVLLKFTTAKLLESLLYSRFISNEAVKNYKIALENIVFLLVNIAIIIEGVTFTKNYAGCRYIRKG